jgi:hypothetical protein
MDRNGGRVPEAAGEELKDCYEAAKKNGKEQPCNVVLKVPLSR